MKYIVEVKEANVFFPDKSGVLFRNDKAKLKQGYVIDGVIKEKTASTKHGMKKGNFVEFSSKNSNGKAYVHTKSVNPSKGNHSNAEGDVVVTAPPAGAAASATQQTGSLNGAETSIVSAVKQIASDKTILTGAGVGATIGLLLGVLSGSSKIGTAIVGASIGGFAGHLFNHSSDQSMSAEGRPMRPIVRKNTCAGGWNASACMAGGHTFSQCCNAHAGGFL